MVLVGAVGADKSADDEGGEGGFVVGVEKEVCATEAEGMEEREAAESSQSCRPQEKVARA